MIKTKLIRIRYVICLGLISLLWASCEQEKTAYIDNTELIQSYNKMKAAKKDFESRTERLAEEFDKRASDFQAQVESYQQNANKMSVSEREEEEERLIAMRQEIENDQRKQSRDLEKESEEVADELVKEVRKKVERYGEENNYTYIFGSNESANILYAKRGKDITLEVIEYINGG